MSEFLGMDTATASEHAGQMDSATRRLEELVQEAQQAVASVNWVGPDADSFRTDAQAAFKRLTQWNADCDQRAEELRRHVEEQDAASDGDGGVGGPGAQGGPASPGRLGEGLDSYDNPDDDIAPITQDNLHPISDDDLKPPTSMDAILENLQQAGSRQNDDATNIRVQAVEGPDGETRYIVYVPGSHGNPVNLINPLDTNGNPMDWNQNTGALMGGNTDSKEAVLAAMKAAGIPEGADVAIVGHSQGGIVATNIASDPSINGAPDGYNVTDVISFGSPVENKRPVNGTNSINFYNQNPSETIGFDTVPMLDGPAKPGPNHTEVPLATEGSGFFVHGTQEYRDSLENVDGASADAVSDYMNSESMQNYSGEGSQVRDGVDISVSRDGY